MALCRLCCETCSPAHAQDLFQDVEHFGHSLADLINAYLPLKIGDDVNLPRIVCPGCNIQLEGTVQFLELVIEGQSKLRLLSSDEPLVQKNNENSIDRILENGGVYSKRHPLVLRIERLKPKRKRGRPKKTERTPQLPEENVQKIQIEPAKEEIETIEGKRKRHLPKRFNEVVQGKELEKILREEGVTDEDSDIEHKNEESNQCQTKSNSNSQNAEDEIIGHMETFDNNGIEQLVMINKYKGKVNKVRRQHTIHTCNICSLKLNSLKHYMAHLAGHQTQLQVDTEKNAVNPLELNNITMENQKTIDLSIGLHPGTQEFTDNVFFDSGPSMPDISSGILDNSLQSEKEMLRNSMLDIDKVVFPETILNGDAIETNTILETVTSLDLPNENFAFVQCDNSENKLTKIDDSKIKCKFQCAECGKMFNSKQYCDIHLKAYHLDERPFKCLQCNKTFAYKINLKRHLISHFPKTHKGFACDVCGKILSHPSSVLYHKETEHNIGRRFICKKCGKAFKHIQLLQRHQIVHTENRPFSCQICSLRFKTRQNLVKHMQTHTGIKRFSCDLCKRKFSHKTTLTCHLRSHSGIKPYKCSMCGKSFNQRGNLSEHIRTHTGEKPYACTICQKRFTTSSQQRLHVEHHNNYEKLFVCQECGKRFKSRDAWRCHMKRHSGEKPFSCQTCGRKFVEKWTLRKHLRLHTGEKPFTCNICNRSFADCSNLIKHRKTHREYVQEESDLALGIQEETNNPVLDNTNQVLCLTYENNDEHPAFHIINENELNACELYETEADLLVSENSVPILSDQAATIIETQTTNTIFDQFVDEEGNPIQFTLQDGTQYALTTSEGKFLQIHNEELILSTDVDDNVKTSNNQPSSISNDSVNQTTKFLTGLDENNLSQYFTIT